MSFDIDNFSPIGGLGRAGNSPAHWGYKSSVDDLAAVLSPGYFDFLGTMVAPGDFFDVFLTDGKTIITVLSTTLTPPGVVIDPNTIGSEHAFSTVEFFPGAALNLVVADNLKFFVMGGGQTQTVTIPENASQPFPIGAEIEFMREDPENVSFATSGAANLQSRAGLVSIGSQLSAVALKKIGTDEWRLFGDLA